MLNYTHWFSNFPPALATFLIATLPISELRGALPLGYLVYGLSLPEAFFWSFLGNVLSSALVLAFLESISAFLARHSQIFRRFFDWLTRRIQRKYARRFSRWGALALITFVAIPLPLTGGWTGALAAFVFGIPYKKALLFISLGIFLAGIVVSLLTLAGVYSFSQPPKF